MTREGWAIGSTTGGEWLTILGTHYESPKLYADAASAWEAFRARFNGQVPEWLSGDIAARVRETWHSGVASGRAYQIIEMES